MSITDNDIKNALATIVERTPDLGRRPIEHIAPVQETDRNWRPLLAVAVATVAVSSAGLIAANRSAPVEDRDSNAGQRAATDPSSDIIPTTTLDSTFDYAENAWSAGIPTFDVTVDLDATSFQLDRGHDDGVSVGMPVVNSTGLVGKIQAVIDRKSDVLLITDPNFSVNVEFASSAAAPSLLVATGTGNGGLVLRGKIALSIEDVGAIVYTSGYESTSPRGIPIGTISSIEPDPLGEDPIVAAVTPLTEIKAGPGANVMLYVPLVSASEGP